MEEFVIDSEQQAARIAFVKAMKKGTPRDEVLRTVGIAISTYYKWRARWVEHGERWANGEPITKEKKLPANTALNTRREIIELCLQHPTWSARVLSDHLFRGSGGRFAHSTIHAYLKAAGISTRAGRAEELHRRFLKGHNLTPEQERLAETLDPSVRWKGPKGTAPREILVHETVHLHHTRPTGSAAISIIVDTFDGCAFAHILTGSPSISHVDCAKHVIKSVAARGQQVRQICTDYGYEFGKRALKHPYNELLRSHGISHTLVKSQNNRRSPQVVEAFVEIEKFLFDGGVRDPADFRNRLNQLNPLIQTYLEKVFGHF